MKEIKWGMAIRIEDEEKEKLMLKCAKVCKVVLKKEDGFYLLEDPMPDMNDWEKFLNTLEHREIVTCLKLVTRNDQTFIMLSDTEI